jgi:hypothetical protein
LDWILLIAAAEFPRRAITGMMVHPSDVGRKAALLSHAHCSSLNRPSGHVTGVTLFISELMAKWLELFKGRCPAPPPSPQAKAPKPSPQANLLRITPIAEIQRDTAAVLPKSSKGAEQAKRNRKKWMDVVVISVSHARIA